MKVYFIGFCTFVLASLACQVLSGPGEIDPDSTGTAFENLTPAVPGATLVPGDDTRHGQVLFEDDFSNPFTNWSTGEDGNARLAITASTFQIQIDTAQDLYWSTAGLNFADVRIAVDTEKRAGPASAEYGVICRYDETNGIYNFYYLVIAGDTYAAIIKVVNTEQVEISARNMTFEAIRGGNASNHITAECVGNRLSLFANGIELISVLDSSHTRGDIGLIASTYEEGGIDVRFDNIVVSTP